VVVDAAVEDEMIAASGTRHRLMATGRVDDREAAHSKRCRTATDLAAVIWTAVPHGLAHASHGELPFLKRIA
jgi:hypothetical protein